MITGESGYSRRKLINQSMLLLSSLGAAIAVILLLLILGYIIFRGVAFINLDFLTQASRPIGEAGGGMRNEIIGTLLLVGIGSVVAIPVGLMAGIFLAEFSSPRLAGTVRFVADILAGVPSIVVGVFAYAVLVVPMKSYSALAGGIALAIIMVPIIARTAEEAMRLVPGSMREAALALGITRWRSVMSVVVPGAIAGIVTGIMLGVARAAGETAPLIFTALGNAFGFDGLDKPIGALPLQIWRYAMSPYPDWHQQAWAAAFLLVFIVLLISVVVRWVSRRKR
jgi:phosphate transport system permease protein